MALPTTFIGQISTVAQESTARLPLATLETRISIAPGILADQNAIEAAVQGVRAARDASGLEYTYFNSFGPADLIVTNRSDNFVERYQQTGGLSLPLGGSKITQQLAVLGAQEREQIAVIALHESFRARLAQLRSAYVQYWSFLNQARVARTYLDLSQGELSQAKALRRAGFTTGADLLDFLNSVKKVQSDSEVFSSSARAQLALIGSALGSELPSFRPVAPVFFRDCNPDRRRAIESAYSVDTALAQYDANAVHVQGQLERIHGATIDGRARAGVGSVTDINHRVSGYSLSAGIDVSFPTHARDEERALGAQYKAELRTLALRQMQRRAEISSSVDSIVDDIGASRISLQQALADQRVREVDLRNALIRFTTLRQTSDTGFKDVSQHRNELYFAQRVAAEAQATLLLKANSLLMVAPSACGALYTPLLAPSATTPAPNVKTPAPNVTTPAPSATTPAPNATTPAPSATTPAPSATTSAPSATTSAPSATTSAPRPNET